jgi:hypothetical protein
MVPRGRISPSYNPRDRMRKLIAFLAAALVAMAACTTFHGPGAPLAREQFEAGSGLEAAIARDTAERFVFAYASANQDDARELASIVTGPKLRAWAHWLGVQDREFEGTISGTPEVRHAVFVGELQAEGTTGAEVDLDASVTFTYSPNDGQPFTQRRDLSGPLVLIQTGPVDWKVLDGVRDGVRMSDAIELFKQVSIASGGVTVQIDSVFLFAPTWQFNVVVTNGTDAPIRLDPTRVGLFVKSGPDEFTRVTGAVTQSLADVPPGANVEGQMAFSSRSSSDGTVLSLGYTSGHERFPPFAFPLQPLITVPSPSPTASGPGAASPS